MEIAQLQIRDIQFYSGGLCSNYRIYFSICSTCAFTIIKYAKRERTLSFGWCSCKNDFRIVGKIHIYKTIYPRSSTKDSPIFNFNTHIKINCRIASYNSTCICR